MSLYDEQYLTIAQNILDHGYYDTNRTGVSTYKLPHQSMQFDLEREFPILTTKKVAFKTAVRELLWIFKEQSNDVKRLQEQNVHIWDEWEMEDGTIGTSYGWVVQKFHQMDTLLEQLKTNPQDRRMMLNLWQIPYLDTGALYPCCFLTMWDVTDGRLNCMLVQRSGDWGLGVPFNTSQYAVLVHLLAQVSNLRPGMLTHVINNAHIYENQVEGIRLQLTRRAEAFEAPALWINPEIQDFYAFQIQDIKLIGYKSHDKISMEVAV
ncbi:thymidylate synthase [Bianquea renquensis]|uniref:Thymidylate synthase n=1 Tax=Bianquea renquensis TaxID=2763661 RepID=A0A926I2S5_9FIRM|nr:thymidylate synthase [Bianquea renquensis]MBC8544610.1 thymidylate synthase [Bianquea renquensis]